MSERWHLCDLTIYQITHICKSRKCSQTQLVGNRGPGRHDFLVSCRLLKWSSVNKSKWENMYQKLNSFNVCALSLKLYAKFLLISCNSQFRHCGIYKSGTLLWSLESSGNYKEITRISGFVLFRNILSNICKAVIYCWTPDILCWICEAIKSFQSTNSPLKL